MKKEKEKQFLKLTYFLLILNLIDGILTYILIKIGIGKEANPILKYI